MDFLIGIIRYFLGSMCMIGQNKFSSMGALTKVFLLSSVLPILAMGDSWAKKESSTSVTQQAQKEAISEKSTAISDAKAGDKKEVSPVIAAVMRIDTLADQAIVLDFHTGRVLFEKNADQPMFPSSMTKIMTAYMAFDRLKNNVVTPETTVHVSQKAWKMGGSRMFINVDTQVSVNDLLQGIIIQSGNDACVALAELLSGSEEVFAAEMTQKAKEMGCLHTSFRNASGWPDPEHYTTARDLSIISSKLIKDHPEYYHLFSKTEYTYNNITQPNRNPLLDKNIGCDGLKTGFTDLGKYGLVASCREADPEGNETRILLVINGCDTGKIRASEALKLATWATRTFASIPIAKKGQILANMDVSAGAERTVPLSIAQDAYITIPRVAKGDIKTELIYDRSVQAPIAVGQVLGKAIVTAPTLETPIEVQLVATKAIERAGIFKRIWNTISHVFGG